MKIFLIGMPGSGKTTVGRSLALMLNLPFVDLDHEIEKKEGRLIKDIFGLSGEAYFREVESKALKEIALSSMDCVIATGGGAPCFHDGISIINNHGISIFLDVSIDELISRVENNKDRPLLQSADKAELKNRLEGIRKNRLACYQLATCTVTTDDNVDSIINKINQLSKK
ncbi:MAG TPA: shikimate kinase [Cyclobacteriaceae bacterium]